MDPGLEPLAYAARGADQGPYPGPGLPRALPVGLRSGQSWWYAHDRLRKACRSMERLLQRGHLFMFLAPVLEGFGIASTTNWIEGGVNTQVRALLRQHRGMPPAHAVRAVEWWWRNTRVRNCWAPLWWLRKACGSGPVREAAPAETGSEGSKDRVTHPGRTRFLSYMPVSSRPPPLGIQKRSDQTFV